MSSSVSLKSLQFVICFKVLVLSFVIDKLVGFDSRLFVSDVKQMTISIPTFHIRFPCFLNSLLKNCKKIDCSIILLRALFEMSIYIDTQK